MNDIRLAFIHSLSGGGDEDVSNIKLDYSKAYPFFDSGELGKLCDEVIYHHEKLHVNCKKESAANCLGWVHQPLRIDLDEINQINRASQKVKSDSDILIVIGIGGSYLGGRAAIEALQHSFHNNLSQEKRSAPKIFFVGNNLSPTYTADLIDLLHEKDFSINVISKSGTTLEPAIAFRIFRNLLEKKYGKQMASKRIYITTDDTSSPLNSIASTEGYKTFIMPANIGGRYSIFTAAALFPMAVSGICIQDIVTGAITARNELKSPKIAENPAYQYAAIRNILYRKGKTIEILVAYEPSFKYLTEWWKQLFAESEGKDKKGVFPTTAIYSTDLHSLGQYVQEGRRDLFETTIKVVSMQRDIIIEKTSCNQDKLDYLSGETMNYINDKAFSGVVLAHSNGGVPNIVVQIPKMDAYNFGYLVYFFQLSCAMSGFLMGVDPFDQPGVEAYKKNMFISLERPEYTNANMI